MKINPLHSFSLLYFFFLFYCFASVAQNRFEKNYGGTGDEEAYSVLQTADSGFIVAGYTDSYGAGSWDVYIVKTDKDGEVEWTKTYGGTKMDWANSIQPTFDGGYIVGGCSQSFANSGSDFYILKLKFDGDTAWTRTYGFNNEDEFGHSIRQTRDSGYIIIGETYRNGMDDFWLLKLKPNGDTTWSRTYGGSGYEMGEDVLQTPDGGYILAGYKQGDVWVIKTDSNGVVEWEKQYGESGGDGAYAVQLDGDSGYMVGGTYNFGGSPSAFYLLKLKSNGDTIWTKKYGGPGFYRCFAMQTTSDGSYILTGQIVGSTLLFVKADSDGNNEWERRYGCQYDAGMDLQTTYDGGFILAGHSRCFGNSYQFYLIKTDNKGEVVWISEIDIPKNLTVSIEPNPFTEKTILRIPYNNKFTIYDLRFTIYLAEL